LQQLARCLGGAVSNGQVLAPGPGHSAADRSLSVRMDPAAPDGFLVHSFAGDDPIQCRDYVREKAGLPAYKPNGNGRERATDAAIDKAVMAAIMGQAATRPSSVVTRYDYTAEDGTLLYQVQRHEPKRFTQRRPDAKSGWTYQLGDVRRVLYRLPELLKYPDGTVFVCEGEKDADRVASLGHCATTVASGKWTDDCVKVLGNRDVLILEDADEPGHKKALKIAQVLHGIAATVRIIQLPGLTGHPNNKDVSDWLDSDPHRAENLVDACFEAPLWTPETAETATATVSSDGDGAASADKTQGENSEPAPAKPPPIVATPFAWRDPATIPPRAWLYGRHYIRKFLTCTIAPGGHGKTSLVIVEALGMATGRALLATQPAERSRVWLWNGEDPRDEVDRRVTAAMIHHQVNPEDVDGHLFCDNGRETPIILARQTNTGTLVAKPIVDALIETITRNQISALIVDPFVKSHKVRESDNDAIDEVARQWAAIADVTGCAVELLHHPRKTGGAEITVEDSRGAVALTDAARAVRVLNKMNKQQADEAGIEQPTMWRYFRVDDGKLNMAPPPERADWYRLESVPLANGDNVGTVGAWIWPDPFEGVTTHDLRAAQKEVAEGGPWRADVQAADWVGQPIAKALRLNPAKESDKKKIKAVLKAWVRNGMFVEHTDKGRGRHPVKIIKVGTQA
jgi:hypothetical protein